MVKDTGPTQFGANRRRPRLLLLAYVCKPYLGSEPGVGWNRAIQAGRFADTWVLCEGSECESVVRQYIVDNGPVPGVEFVFVPLSRFLAWLRKIPGCYYLAYHLWHRRAYAIAQRLHAEHNFDLAHQVAIIGFREPGLLWRLPIPFIWGPVGGTQNIPYRFLLMFRWLDAAKELARNLINSWQLHMSRRVHAAAHKASALIAASTTNQRDLARACGVPVLRMLEIGVPHVTNRPANEKPHAGELRILWSANMEVRKALPLLIEALALLPAEFPWNARIVGNGHTYRECRRLARKRNLDDRMEWLGWLSHDEALDQCNWADVYVFTSLRDTTGSVILEALAHGVPVICLDHQGAADVVTKACGIKIAVTSPRQVARELSNALQEFSQNPDRRHQLCLGAKRQAEVYLWARLGERMANVYRKVLSDVGSEAELQEIDVSSTMQAGQEATARTTISVRDSLPAPFPPLRELGPSELLRFITRPNMGTEE